MKTFICSHVGSTEVCSDCEYCLPANELSGLDCVVQANAKHIELHFPAYYKDENSYYLLKTPESAVKFTLHEKTFFASAFSDAHQIANLFLSGQKITEDIFTNECIPLIQSVLREANMNVYSLSSTTIHSDSFL